MCGCVCVCGSFVLFLLLLPNDTIKRKRHSYALIAVVEIQLCFRLLFNLPEWPFFPFFFLSFFDFCFGLTFLVSSRHHHRVLLYEISFLSSFVRVLIKCLSVA